MPSHICTSRNPQPTIKTHQYILHHIQEEKEPRRNRETYIHLHQPGHTPPASSYKPSRYCSSRQKPYIDNFLPASVVRCDAPLSMCPRVDGRQIEFRGILARQTQRRRLPVRSLLGGGEVGDSILDQVQGCLLRDSEVLVIRGFVFGDAGQFAGSNVFLGSLLWIGVWLVPQRWLGWW